MIKTLIKILKDIETKELNIKPARNPSDIFAGDVEYQISNGWKIVIFNDCNDWDYVDSFITPQGLTIDLWNTESNKDLEILKSYRPSDEVCKSIYKIGYL